jgi:hypothetical protein
MLDATVTGETGSTDLKCAARLGSPVDLPQRYRANNVLPAPDRKRGPRM